MREIGEFSRPMSYFTRKNVKNVIDYVLQIEAFLRIGECQRLYFDFHSPGV